MYDSSLALGAPAVRERIPFTRYDLGWVILCIGMAIGAGIVFLPVQVGIVGIWAFAASVVLAYPALYMMQALYLQTLSESPESEDYVSIITHYLGRNWGILLGVCYMLMLLGGMLTYSLAVTFDSAKYIQTFGLTTGLISDNPLYALAILALLVLVAAQGERLLFKVAGPLVVFKFGIIVLLGIVMFPYWDPQANIPSLPAMKQFLIDTALTLPFTLFSILFVQILSPMNIAFRRVESDPRIASYRAMRANRIAYIVLAVSVLFFAFSFSMTLSHEQALAAAAENISALAMAASVIPADAVLVMSTALNIFAIVTAFLSIYLGFEEALNGLAMNIITRFVPEERVNRRVVSLSVCVFIVVALWAWVQSNFPILLLQQLSAPLIGITAFLVPCLLVYKVPALSKYRSPRIYFILAFGIIICAAPFLKALGY